MLLKGNPGQTGHFILTIVLMFIGILEKMSSCQDFLGKTTPTFRIANRYYFYSTRDGSPLYIYIFKSKNIYI
jgi:hypothetical protein